MMWPTEAQSYLDGGGSPLFFVALLIAPVRLSDGLRVSMDFWSGHEDIVADLGGAPRNLWRTNGALIAENPSYATGTDIRTYRLALFGLSDRSEELLAAYDANRAPVEVYQMMFTPGMVFKGGRRRFKGEVDTMPRDIGPKGEGATLSINLVSSARAGTETTATKKSNESYRRRSGDTSMEYASLRDAESDWWGARG